LLQLNSQQPTANSQQPYCSQIEEDLNKYFNNTSSKTYNNSGVFVHTFDGLSISKQNQLSESTQSCDNQKYRFCPSDSAIKNGFVSFSYLRRDIMPSKGTIIYPYNTYSGGGFIFKNDKIKPTCFYPVNAISVGRYEGCGKHDDTTPNTYFCSSLGITTEEKFFTSYNNPPDGSKICAIRSDNFSLFIQTSQKTQYSEFSNNEVIVPVWTVKSLTEIQNIDIWAFFYVMNAPYDMKPDTDFVNLQANLFNQNVPTELKKCVCRVDYNELKTTSENNSYLKSNTDRNPFTCSMPSNNTKVGMYGALPNYKYSTRRY